MRYELTDGRPSGADRRPARVGRRRKKKYSKASWPRQGGATRRVAIQSNRRAVSSRPLLDRRRASFPRKVNRCALLFSKNSAASPTKSVVPGEKQQQKCLGPFSPVCRLKRKSASFEMHTNELRACHRPPKMKGVNYCFYHGSFVSYRFSFITKEPAGNEGRTGTHLRSPTTGHH